MKRRFWGLVFFAVVLGASPVWAARDASFLSPAASVSKGGQDTVGIEPKSEIDLGDTPVNIARRTTVFFVNQSSLPVEIASILSTGDANVRAEIVADDCTRQGTIAVASRCSVSVETTPLAPGAWTAEIMMTHKAAGRLARAKIIGKTGGNAASDKRELGLELSTRDIKPVDFGEVDVGEDRAVRSALMVNDSNDNIKILSIEVIAAENGLARLDQGCLLNEELKPGESCPVTLVWAPKSRGIISTDLILRHTGKRGFAVIPVRGKALGGGNKEGDSTSSGGLLAAGAVGSGSKNIPLSPTADELEGMIKNGQIAPLSSGALGSGSSISGSADFLGSIRLIGTVGERAVFYADGATFVAHADEVMTIRDKAVTVVSVMPRQAVIRYGDKKRMLSLETAPALTASSARRGSSSNMDQEVVPVDSEKEPLKSAPIPTRGRP